MHSVYDDALDLPRDEDGRVVGYSVGKAAALSDWQVRKEAADEKASAIAKMKELGARTRRPPTKVDWSAQPLGVEKDAVIAARLGVAP